MEPGHGDYCEARPSMLQCFNETLTSGFYSPDLQQRQLVYMFKSSMTPDRLKLPRSYLQKRSLARPGLCNAGRKSTPGHHVPGSLLAYLSPLYYMPNLMYESRRFYGRSLSLLNKSLSDPCQGRSSETLSATILLSYYEMFSSSHETSVGYDS